MTTAEVGTDVRRNGAVVSPRIALVLEQTLGHRTHGLNLGRACASREQPIDVFRVDYPERRRVRLPWALRGSVAAYRQLRRARQYDLTFFHTQTVSLLAPRATRNRPFAIGVDATPVQLDEMGKWYRHPKQSRLLEAAKKRWYRSVFGRAEGVVTWSAWAARSVVEDYGANPDSLLIAHPGAPQEFFEIPREARRERPRILFVGGDFERKGGDSLLRAFRSLSDKAELVLVTDAAVPAHPGVRVLSGIRPGTAEQLGVFRDADIFCLPTLGDCTSVAIGEAMAAGLPVVTTNVASNPEWVPDDVGVLVPPSDDQALTAALRLLVADEQARSARGRAARAWASEHMSAGRNAERVLDFLVALAAGKS